MVKAARKVCTGSHDVHIYVYKNKNKAFYLSNVALIQGRKTAE